MTDAKQSKKDTLTSFKKGDIVCFAREREALKRGEVKQVQIGFVLMKEQSLYYGNPIKVYWLAPRNSGDYELGDVADILFPEKKLVLFDE